MNQILHFLQDRILSPEKPTRERLVTICLLFSSFAGVVGTIATIIQASSIVAIIAIMMFPISTVILQIWVKKTKQYDLCCIIFTVLLCYIIFPIIFFSGGGMQSGMIVYFTLGAVTLFLLVGDNIKTLVTMATLYILINFSCMLISFFYPSTVTPIGEYAMGFFDIVVAVTISTILILIGLFFQNAMFKAEQKRAYEAIRAKDEFLASMSHELRTPLNAIIGLSATQIELEDESSIKNKDIMKKINYSGTTLLGIINDLLDVSKIGSGKFELVHAEYDTGELIHNSINMNKVRIGEKPIEFNVKIDPLLPSVLYGDDLRIRQILNNMLSNAFKYTNEGNVTLDISCKIEGDEALLVIIVSDSGMGIMEDDLPRIFDKYNKLGNAQTRYIEGTGLGLSITKELVKMMNGDITVDSVYGKGSTFTASIRQKMIDPTPIGKIKSEAFSNFDFREEKQSAEIDSMNQKSYEGCRFLVVDDVEINLFVAREMLLPYDAVVDCVESGQEAIDLISNGDAQYDIIFMDHMMPGIDGIEATRIIHEEIDSDYARNIPIVALTANVLVGNEEKFLDSGFRAFLPKPIDSKRLSETLSEILN